MKTNYSRKSSFWQDLSSKSRVYAKPLCKPINKIMLHYDPGRRILSLSLSLLRALKGFVQNGSIVRQQASPALSAQPPPQVSEVCIGWSCCRAQLERFRSARRSKWRIMHGGPLAAMQSDKVTPGERGCVWKIRRSAWSSMTAGLSLPFPQTDDVRDRLRRISTKLLHIYLRRR